MFHQEVPARLLNHHLLVHLLDLVQKYERMEVGAASKDSLWLGPFRRGCGLVGLTWVLVLLRLLDRVLIAVCGNPGRAST